MFVIGCIGSTEMAPKNFVSEIIPSLTFAALLFWELGWLVERRRPDLRELNIEYNVADIDFPIKKLKKVGNFFSFYFDFACLFQCCSIQTLIRTILSIQATPISITQDNSTHPRNKLAQLIL